MTGEQFKALGLEQQVEYINELLQEGNTVDNIRMALGVGKNYIGNNFSKGGYKKDRATGLYIKAGTEANKNTTTNEKAQKLNNKALSGSNSGNNSNSLEKRVEGLEKQLEAIKAMLEANNTNAISDGYYHESFYKSAPAFDLRIDGLTLVNEAY